MNHFEKFQEALEIEQKSENTFTLIPNTNYFVGNTPHGGYLMHQISSMWCISNKIVCIRN